MKVAIPTADYPPIEGGIGTVALETSRALAAQGHDVTVIAPHFPGMAQFDSAEPVRVVRYRGYGLGWFRFFPLMAASLPHMRRADLVLGINVAYGGVIAYLLGRPYVTFAYAYEFLKFRRNRALSWLLRRVYARSCVVVAISTFTKEKLIEFGVREEGVEVVFPGASLVQGADASIVEEVVHRYVLDSPHVILAIGRFIPRKGQLTLVESFPRVLEKYPDAILVLAGRGPTLEDVARRAERLGIRSRVRLPGRVSNEEIMALYEVCELFALPTGRDERGQIEGFGLVFSEAHAFGKPVVAGRSGGVVDAVVDGETGLIVPPDDPAALAEAILSLMDRPEEARRMGERGRRRIEEELNWTHFTERMLAAVEKRA